MGSGVLYPSGKAFVAYFIERRYIELTRMNRWTLLGCAILDSDKRGRLILAHCKQWVQSPDFSALLKIF